MKLFELLHDMENYKRVRRVQWIECFLIRSSNMTGTLIRCDFYSLVMDKYLLTLEDLLANDWELIT